LSVEFSVLLCLVFGDSFDCHLMPKIFGHIIIADITDSTVQSDWQ